MLGPEPFTQDEMRKNVGPGVVTGLAWTETGGDVLYIEATLLPDGNGLTLTGQLGDVMKESAKAAQSWVWSHAEELGIDPAVFKYTGVHIHVPAGAIPKDGPSAGITMATALASVYTKCPARNDTAMTGEITLSGLVLPIGGVKEKVLAARRAGIKRVILPKANQKDLREFRTKLARDGIHLCRANRRSAGERGPASRGKTHPASRLIWIVEGPVRGAFDSYLDSSENLTPVLHISKNGEIVCTIIPVFTPSYLRSNSSRVEALLAELERHKQRTRSIRFCRENI